MINISRKNSLILGLGIIVLFFATGIFMLYLSKPRQLSKASEAATVDVEQPAKVESETVEAAAVKSAETPADPAAPVTLSKFQRNEIRDGRKIWEVTAERGRYIPQSNSAELEEAELIFHRDDGSLVKLVADEAKLHFSGTQLENAEVSGSVEMIFDGKVQVKAANALYSRPDEIVTVPGKVNIMTDRMELVGSRLSVNLASEELDLKGDVSTVIQPRNK